MHRPRRWRRTPRRGVSEIIGAILLVALTVVAGVVLWSFRLYTPPAPPSLGIQFRSGGSNPVWGDPTDCQPFKNALGTVYTLASYPLSGAANITEWRNAWNSQCASPNVSGNFSLLNTSQFIITSHTPANIPLSELNLSFVCNGADAPAPYTTHTITILVQGSLDSMTWFPGSSSSPAPNAPHLGYCGGFDASGFGGGAFGVLYNRLAIFTPLNQGVPVVENGDTFYLYIHNGGWPLDFYCVAMQAGLFGDSHTDCPLWINSGTPASVYAHPVMDADDYHGAPPWCFQAPGACTIYITYTGSPGTLLATIPVSELAPPGGF